MRPSKEVGARLQKIREGTGLNSRQFSLAHEFDPSVWARVEKGKAGLPEHYLTTILDKLKVNSHWLLTGEGEMFTTPTPPFTPILGRIEPDEPDYMRVFLERQMQLMAMLTEGQVSVRSEVKDAKELAVTARSEVKDVAESLAHLKDTVSMIGEKSDALLVWTAENVGPLVKKQALAVVDEVDTIVIQSQQVKKTGKLPGVGRKNIKAKT